MQQLNFGNIDYSAPLNRTRQEGQNLMQTGYNAVNNFAQGLSSWSEKERQRKKEEELKKQVEDALGSFNSQKETALGAKKNYLDAVMESGKLQAELDDVNKSNASIQANIDELQPKFDRVQRSMNRPTGYGEDATARNNIDGSFAKYQNSGAWNVASINPYERQLNEYKSQLRDTSDVERRLAESKANEARYKNESELAGMYADPRFEAAMRMARVQNDPSAVYNYMNSYNAEQGVRQQNDLVQRQYNAFKEMQGNYNANYSVDDFAEYGKTAQMLFAGMMNAQDPQTFYQYQNALNNIVTTKESQRSIKQQQLEDNRVNAAYQIQEFENALVNAAKQNDPEYMAKLVNMKNRYKATYGVDYDSGENVGLQAGRAVANANKESSNTRKERAKQLALQSITKLGGDVNDSFWNEYYKREYNKYLKGTNR